MDVVTARLHESGNQRPSIAWCHCSLNRTAARADRPGEGQSAEAVRPEIDVARDKVPIKYGAHSELAAIAGAINVNSRRRCSIVELDAMRVRNRTEHRVVELVGDLDSHFPKVVARAAPVAEQVFDVIHILLVLKKAAAVRNADIRRTVPSSK